MERGKNRSKRRVLDELEGVRERKRERKGSRRRFEQDSKAEDEHFKKSPENEAEAGKRSRNSSPEDKSHSVSSSLDGKVAGKREKFSKSRSNERFSHDSGKNGLDLNSRTGRSEPKRNGEFERVDKEIIEALEGFEESFEVTTFRFVCAVGSGALNPVRSADALKNKFLGKSKNSTLVFKVLDLISFFLDDPKKRQNLLVFLESLESFGVVSSLETIAAVDPAKLDTCNYSEGLVKISIRERTRNNYVLKVYNLFRENPVGYSILNNFFTSLKNAYRHNSNSQLLPTTSHTNQHTNSVSHTQHIQPNSNRVNLGYVTQLGESSSNTVKDSVEYSEQGNVVDNSVDSVDKVVCAINMISSVNKLCPVRALYELFRWLVSSDFPDDFISSVLKSYPRKNVAYVALLYLKRCYKSKFELIERDLGSMHNNKGVGDSFGAVQNNKGISDRVYWVLGMMVIEGYFTLGRVYNFLDLPDELLSSLSVHFFRVLKNSSNRENREPNSASVPLLKKILASDLNFSQLNPNLTVLASKVREREFVKDRLERENEYKKSAFLQLESLVNKHKCNDYSILLKFENYGYLKDCVYSLECGKFLLLSSMLSKCGDFQGKTWDLCYSFILHLCKNNFYIFLNTTIVGQLNKVVERVLSGSDFYRYKVCDELVSVDWMKEEVVFNKLEYYFKLVGFRCSEDAILFNSVLTYLHSLLSHLLAPEPGCKDVGERDRICRGVKRLIYKYVLFNVINCCEGNFQISDKIWEVLRLFTTLERYQIYSRTIHLLSQGDSARVGRDNLECEYYSHQLILVRKVYNSYNYKLKSIFKKITYELLKSVKSPTIRSIVSIITAISAINPFSVCTLIIRQSELFNNLLLPLCELTKYFLSYTIDVFLYNLTINLIRLVNAPKNAPNAESQGLSDGRLEHNFDLTEDENSKMYVNSVILCKIFKRHYESDIIPIVTILTLVLNYSLSHKVTLSPTLSDRSSDSVELRIDGIYVDNYYKMALTIYNVLDYLVKLMEIIGGMVDVDMNKMTHEQLLSQCGSFSLANESLVTNVEDEMVSVNNKKSLVRVICRPFFVHSLILVLGRLTNELMYDSNFTNTKLLLSIVDKFTSLVTLFVHFLQVNEQAHLIPSKKLLLKFYTHNHLQFITNFNSSNHTQLNNSVKPSELGNSDDLLDTTPHDNLNETVNPNTVKDSVESSELGNVVDNSVENKDEVLDDNFIKFINNLTIRDIYVPNEQYEECIQRLTVHMNGILSQSGTSNTARRVRRIKHRIASLTAEREVQSRNCEAVLADLAEICKNFVKNESKVGPHITTRFIAQIVFSRLFVSELNSLFCCKVVDLVLQNRTNYFNYFDFVNCYTKMLVPLIPGLTEREVINLSIFFNHSFRMIRRWVSNRDEFERLVVDNPCFCTTFKFQPNKEFKFQHLVQVIKKWEYIILLIIFDNTHIHSHSTHTKLNTVNTTNSVNTTQPSPDNTQHDESDPVNTNQPSSNNVNSVNSTKLGESRKLDNTVDRDDNVNQVEPSWVEVKNTVIFLNKLSQNFPITLNSSQKILNFLKNVLKIAKANSWQDVTVPTNTLIKLVQMYQSQNKYTNLQVNTEDVENSVN